LQYPPLTAGSNINLHNYKGRQIADKEFVSGEKDFHPLDLLLKFRSFNYSFLS
jgi:hypothetical protein